MLLYFLVTTLAGQKHLTSDFRLQSMSVVAMLVSVMCCSHSRHMKMEDKLGFQIAGLVQHLVTDVK